MGLLRLLVLCTLAACCMARSPPGPPPPPPPQRPFSPLQPLGCNDSQVLAVAGFALQSINRDQKDGYMLSLNRVHDVQEHYQEDMGSLFYLTLDVLETGCHVLSRKAQKDCKPKIFYEAVYGQCKAMFHINKPRRVLYLLAYNCTLRPVSQRKTHTMCPDCPRPFDLSNPNVLEAATESLAKFNSESPSKQYALVKVTKATGQWVAGPSYYVEYLIKESPCTKSQASCSLQPSDSEPVGLCQGSLSQTSTRQFPFRFHTFEKTVTVTCEFFESQAQVPGGENPAVTQAPKKVPQKNTAVATSSPSITAPRGSIQHLPDLDVEKPEDSKGESPEETFPVQLDLTTNPQGDTLDVSFLYLDPEEKKLVVLPFPGKEQRSAECPGPAEEKNPLILPP
ncbi:fetuin-B [Grammomys surdaster]|uniref:fetuin-B n=1 Tax=Grammomys surdaster TaxID=491861 RepID=UPI00109FCFFE|nr:fetuin-B [Grammomys surdaster]XP_028635513.1 fetuin-B [Grammomys surdaster]XP_028635514.1 fetuin-B [Grammomys surdaster]